METNEEESAIKKLVHTAVEIFAQKFRKRHLGELDDVEGTLNSKIHNVFIATISPEIQFYSALVRSFDSSLGNMLEGLGINIATIFYDVAKSVEGPLTIEQTKQIAVLLDEYKNLLRKPSVNDYLFLRTKPDEQSLNTKQHNSDYCLTDKESGQHFLIELKIGGDLDNKKARAEKEALLEQHAILSNLLPKDTRITVYFATAYNRFGEGKEWSQGRVRQFFANDELLIGPNFWNFVCKSQQGYKWVIEAYKESVPSIVLALDDIKKAYLKV